MRTGQRESDSAVSRVIPPSVALHGVGSARPQVRAPVTNFRNRPDYLSLVAFISPSTIWKMR